DELAETMRLMRNFGFNGYDNFIYPGTNGKMIEVCAAMGLANLEGFEETIAANMRHHEAYKQALVGVPNVTLLDYGMVESNSHHYVVLEVGADCKTSRDDIIAALRAENILARKYFWPGCHMMQPYRGLFPHAGLMLPNTIELAERVLVLPSGANISADQIQVVGDVIRVIVYSS